MRLPEDLVGGGSTSPDAQILSLKATSVNYTNAAFKITVGNLVTRVDVVYYIYGVNSGSTSITLTSLTQEDGYKSVTGTLLGLDPGIKYQVEVTPYIDYANDIYGTVKSIWFTTPKPAAAATVETFRSVENPNATGLSSSNTNTTNENTASAPATNTTGTSTQTVAQRVISEQSTKSVMQLTAPKDSEKYLTAEKAFSKIDTSRLYYAFGTTMYMKATLDSVHNVGGFMIFSDNNGQTGYYISIQSADTADLRKQNAFRVLKVEGQSINYLEDSQGATTGKFGAIYAGQSYKIDVLIEKASSYIKFYIYINGFRIIAADTTVSATSVILPATNKISLVAEKGTVYFDYVYGMNITYEEFRKGYIFNGPTGKLSKAVLTATFGEKFLDNNSTESSNAEIEEFGPTAKEIKYYKVPYSSAPGIPMYVTSGGNENVVVLNQKLSSFGAEIYVMNNASTYVPLAGIDSNNLWVIGSALTRTGDIEYVDDQAGKFSVPRPVIFDSTWLQKESDVINLANWIKTFWNKKNYIVTMSVTGNPLLSVGDVVKIKYDYLGFSGTDKFVITNITQSYSDGLDTQITCRTL